ncbi:hypothetical protein [Streptomyces bikiniensis]|uniref:hypothetical protein n=1 Tax=Streptomyces bikiniensis TaxID=1896 RepID=UPI00068C2969|nr:hypothetical protein [Streptomyces bikiniensis]
MSRAKDTTTDEHARAGDPAVGEDVVEERLAEEKAAKEKPAALEGTETSGHGFVPALLSPRNAVLVHARSEERYDFALLRHTLGRPAGRDGQGGSGGGGRGAHSPSSRGRERDRRPDPRFRGGRRRSGAGRIRRSMDGEG